LKARFYDFIKKAKQLAKKKFMIRITQEDEFLRLEADKGDLAPRHESQLAFWGSRATAG